MIPDTYFKGQNVWILKVTGFNRGVGIHVFNTLTELFKLLKEYSDQLGDKQSYQMRECLRLLIK